MILILNLVYDILSLEIRYEYSRAIGAPNKIRKEGISKENERSKISRREGGIDDEKMGTEDHISLRACTDRGEAVESGDVFVCRVPRYVEDAQRISARTRRARDRDPHIQLGRESHAFHLSSDDACRVPCAV